LRALLGVAIALGAWGLIQWAGHFTFGAAGDVGVRSGVRLTTSGTGQLQGGEYGFPVAIVTCVSVLLSGNVRSRVGRVALAAAIVLNGASCLLTFERSFWLATVLGLAVVVLRARPGQRAKALLLVPLALLVSVGVLALAAPATLSTASQRLLSVGSYSSDDSVRYRLAESRVVLDAIHAHPLVGSGLAASVHWGQPWAQVPPKSYTFSHDGYLWIAWKLGLPASILLVALCAAALVLRRPRGEASASLAVRQGAQGALAGVLLATLTFPSLSQLSITPVVGLLLALAVCRAERAEGV
jgi:O-antigen ligase